MSDDGAFVDPGIPDGERTVYRATVDGRVVGEGTNAVSVTDEALVQRIDLRHADDFAADLELTFGRRRGQLVAEHYRLESFNEGKAVSREEGWFRNVKVLGWGATVSPYPRSLTPLLGCAIVLRGLDFEKGLRRELAIWLSFTVWWPIEVHVEKREDVEVVAGTFDAWRVRARPRFEGIGPLDRVIGAVLPAFVLHFAADAPHRLVRFTFPTGPFPWNPRARIETIAIEDA